MRRSKLIAMLLVLAFIAVGCKGDGGGSSGGGGLSASVEIDRDLRAFGEALDSTLYESAAEERQAVLDHTYNTPTNPFWTLTLWLGVEKYNFKSWTKSIAGNEATVVLKYTVTWIADGTESNEMTKTFIMRRFDDKWRVDLSEFLNLD